MSFLNQETGLKFKVPGNRRQKGADDGQAYGLCFFRVVYILLEVNGVGILPGIEVVNTEYPFLFEFLALFALHGGGYIEPVISRQPEIIPLAGSIVRDGPPLYIQSYIREGGRRTGAIGKGGRKGPFFVVLVYGLQVDDMRAVVAAQVPVVIADAGRFPV